MAQFTRRSPAPPCPRRADDGNPCRLAFGHLTAHQSEAESLAPPPAPRPCNAYVVRDPSLPPDPRLASSQFFCSLEAGHTSHHIYRVPLVSDPPPPAAALDAKRLDAEAER